MLEPWGDHVFIPSGESYAVVERSSEGKSATVEWAPDHVSIWANNQTSDLEVRRPDGTLVWSNGPAADEIFARLQRKKLRDVVAAIRDAGEGGLGQEDALSRLAAKGVKDPGDELLTLVEHGMVAVDDSGRVRVRTESTAA